MVATGLAALAACDPSRCGVGIGAAGKRACTAIHNFIFVQHFVTSGR